MLAEGSPSGNPIKVAAAPSLVRRAWGRVRHGLRQVLPFALQLPDPSQCETELLLPFLGFLLPFVGLVLQFFVFFLQALNLLFRSLGARWQSPISGFGEAGLARRTALFVDSPDEIWVAQPGHVRGLVG